MEEHEKTRREQERMVYFERGQILQLEKERDGKHVSSRENRTSNYQKCIPICSVIPVAPVQSSLMEKLPVGTFVGETSMKMEWNP